jgi:hypothetical protein
MANEKPSLLAGRNNAPLTLDEVRRATNTFLGLDDKVNARYDPDSRSAFWISLDENGTHFGEIVFGPDIYPGSSVVDPNSALSLDAAAAHELTHYHRWKDKTALSEETLEHVDEALTSLLAVFRYDRQLNQTDVRQLVADAIQRLQLFVREQTIGVASADSRVPDVPRDL